MKSFMCPPFSSIYCWLSTSKWLFHLHINPFHYASKKNLLLVPIYYLVINFFHQKPPSLFDRVLNTSLALYMWLSSKTFSNFTMYYKDHCWSKLTREEYLWFSRTSDRINANFASNVNLIKVNQFACIFRGIIGKPMFFWRV